MKVSEVPETEACPNCGRLKEWAYTLLCNACRDAKEAAYAECKRDGISEWAEIIIRREKALGRRRKTG